MNIKTKLIIIAVFAIVMCWIVSAGGKWALAQGEVYEQRHDNINTILEGLK
jgi:hypothetical protein